MTPAPPIRRILAFVIDWFVVAAWGAALFGVVMLRTGGDLSAPPDPWTGQLIGFVSMTLPVVLYFGLLESTQRGASLGKRAMGLRVTTTEGARLSVGSSIARSAVRFVPWEIGHLVAQQGFAAGESGPPGWVIPLMVVSVLVPAWWVLTLWIRGSTPYDTWTGTAVSSVAPRERA